MRVKTCICSVDCSCKVHRLVDSCVDRVWRRPWAALWCALQGAVGRRQDEDISFISHSSGQALCSEGADILHWTTTVAKKKVEQGEKTAQDTAMPDPLKSQFLSLGMKTNRCRKEQFCRKRGFLSHKINSSPLRTLKKPSLNHFVFFFLLNELLSEFMMPV